MTQPNNKVNFTKAALEQIKDRAIADGARLRVGDAKARGLIFDVTANGACSFYVRRKMNGRSIWERLGEYNPAEKTALTIEQARNEAAAVFGAMLKGHNPQEVRLARRAEPTLGELFANYLHEHARERRKTWRVMERNFNLYLGERSRCNLAARKASDVSFSDVRKLKEAMRDVPYAANRTLQLLRSVYNHAIKSRSFKGENPCTGISLYEETPRNRFLEAEEVQRFLVALNEEPNIDTKDFVFLSLLTGQRKMEVLSMRFADVDFTKGTWTIPETKNGSTHIVALTGIELSIIERRKNEQRETGAVSEFVFPGTGKCGHLQDPDKSWDALRRRAGLPDITIHDLRRNLGSWMASQNVNLSLISGALNHKDMKTTLKVYAKTSKDAEREAREQAHHAMLSAAGDAGAHLLKQILAEKKQRALK